MKIRVFVVNKTCERSQSFPNKYQYFSSDFHLPR